MRPRRAAAALLLAAALGLMAGSPAAAAADTAARLLERQGPLGKARSLVRQNEDEAARRAYGKLRESGACAGAVCTAGPGRRPPRARGLRRALVLGAGIVASLRDASRSVAEDSIRPSPLSHSTFGLRPFALRSGRLRARARRSPGPPPAPARRTAGENGE